MAEVDLANRDPNSLNDHLGVSYEEVLGEPDATHSIDCIWTNSYKCFNMWLSLCYKICTTLCGLCIAMGWGCYFAFVSFHHIWYLTPFIKAYEINIRIYAKIYAIWIKNCCEPCCESCGKMFEAFKK